MTSTMDILRKHRFTMKQKYGQNFLTDGNIVKRMVESAEVSKEDTVIEIGPGLGIMTQQLAKQAKKVIAVEIDHALIPVLEETLGECSNVLVVQGDILKVDLPALMEKEQLHPPFKVVANLPYYITTPIIMGLLEGGTALHSITVMIQKEVAERMVAGPGTKDYGALSVAVQYHALARIMGTVSPECFIPRPNVDSTIIRLTLYAALPVTVADEGFFFAMVRAAFGQRRKTFVNAVYNGIGEAYHLTKEQLTEVLGEMGIHPSTRGEALTLEQFAGVAEKILLNF